MTKLTLFNSLTRKKEDFTPLDPNHVKLYACGPTVYNYEHIGNARMAVVFDVLSRVLKTQYPRVTYVSNITDIDDKIIAASAETGEAIDVITKKYTKIYNDDMAALGCALPDIQPKATTHIGEMVKLIQRLIDTGHAYESEGHVLFHVPSFPAYGSLSGRSRDEQIAGARVEVASYKKDPADFVLWKPSSDDEPGWGSPFGYGRPGWHIECSAMAEKHLGLPFDIHGGGADLKFPHHENEIAQSCCGAGALEDASAFAKFWVHNGFLTVEGEKMSKSLGNFLLVHDLLESHKGEVLRLAMLSAHYRQPLDWGEQVLHQAVSLLNKAYSLLHENDAVKVGDLPQSLMDALSDDLNTPKAISEIHALIAAGDIAALKAAGRVLGVLQEDPKEWLGLDCDIDFAALLEERATAKATKNWARADEIRDEIAAQGYKILDTPDGAKVKKI